MNDLNEDIKILEEILKISKTINYAMETKDLKAIENLLKRYKELDEYTLSLEEEDKKYPIKLTESGYKKLIENKGIPISVIQNKKRELEKKKEYLWDEYDESVVEVMCRYSSAIKVLNELLEERNK